MSGIGKMLRRRGSLALAVALLGSLVLAGVASAATYNVTDTRDLTQSGAGAAAGTCVSTASTCTLRAAIEAANENGGASTINLGPGTYPINSSTGQGATCDQAGKNNTQPLQCCPTGADMDLTTGSFKINPGNNSTDVTLVGAGSGNTVIDAQGLDRIFQVFTNGVLDIQKTTLENGIPEGCSDFLQDGGAIYSSGHTSAESSVFTGNSASFGGAVYADNTSGSTLSLTADVFQNNNAGTDGGAVYTDAPNDISISLTLLQENSAAFDGGAIYGSDLAAGLTMNFDDLVQNVADGEGGGVFWFGNGALNVTNSLFNQNGTSGSAEGTSGDGGGIYIETNSCLTADGVNNHSCIGASKNGNFSSNNGGVNVNVGNTSFDGNSAAGDGGAIEDAGSNGLDLTQDKFSNNDSGGYGGALSADSANAAPSPGTTVTGSEFDGNSTTDSGGWGGGIYWADLAPLALIGDSFVLNSSDVGGALYAYLPSCSGECTPPPAYPFAMVNSTMSRNTATTAGGGIGLGEGSTYSEIPATIFNDTIAFNNAPAGAGGGLDDGHEFTSGGSPSTGFGIENTTIAENSGGDCGTDLGLPTTFQTSFDTGNNNDSDQSCFGGIGGPNDKTGVNPLLSNPANNGGPAAGGPGDTEIVQTDAEQANSPTVNAGNNAGCPAVDERGVPRPQGGTCDIGAFEFGASPTTTTSTSTTVTIVQGGTTTTTTGTIPQPTKKHKKCPKGKVRKHGRCVKQHKHKHKHHKKG